MTDRHQKDPTHELERKQTGPRTTAWIRFTAMLALLIVPILCADASRVEAARDADITATAAITGETEPTNLQLVVLEAPGCTYCSMFRRYIVPAYQTSPKSRSLPLKFIDLNDKAYDELGLDSPVDMVPTTVLMHNNREVGRIPGYVGPENFFHAINHLMARVN
ncbi:MAG TPA: thioredoxin family protein [Hyphomicrobiaceae bacterium]|nr:thioredoxin family protein [Hyphomicrobiaceae bacterium]